MARSRKKPLIVRLRRAPGVALDWLAKIIEGAAYSKTVHRVNTLARRVRRDPLSIYSQKIERKWRADASTLALIPRVFVVVLTYNGIRFVNKCLESVLKSNYPNLKVLVIDNGSRDGTCEFIKSNFSKQAALLEKKKNTGLAEGFNLGATVAFRSSAQYIVLLHQDTILDPQCLATMVEVAESDKSIGILVPTQWNYDGSSLDRHFSTALAGVTVNPNAGFIASDRACGAAMMIKDSVIRDIGVFDPFFYSSYAEQDYCRRAVMDGYKVGVSAKSKVFHWNATLSRRRGLWTRYMGERNRFYYQLKNPHRTIGANLNAYMRITPMRALVFAYVIPFAIAARLNRA